MPPHAVAFAAQPPLPVPYKMCWPWCRRSSEPYDQIDHVLDLDTIPARGVGRDRYDCATAHALPIRPACVHRVNAALTAAGSKLVSLNGDVLGTSAEPELGDARA